MSIDKIGCWFDKMDIQFVSKKRADLRHAYLFGMCGPKGKSFHNDTDDYFPTIIRFYDGILFESCPAKALFGHNLYEVCDRDLDDFIRISLQQLEYAGILIHPDMFKQVALTRLDYNKLILFPFTLDFSQRIIREAKQSGRLQKGICIYPNSGEGCVNALKHRKLILYDKLKEAQDKGIIPCDLMELVRMAQLSVMNVEFQMHGKQEIERELTKQKINTTNSLQNLFKVDYARVVIQNRVQGLLDNVMTIKDSNYSLLETIEQQCASNSIHGVTSIASQVAFAWMIQTFGVNFTYEWIKNHSNKKYAHNYWKKIKNLSYPKQQEELVIRDIIASSINSFQPVTLQTYQNFKDMEWNKIIPQCVGNTTKSLKQQGGENNGSTVSVC